MIADAAGLRAWLFGSRLYAASLGKRTADTSQAEAADAWPGDAERGAAIAAGRDPFDADPWGEFAWLRDLGLDGGTAARRMAKYHVHAWCRRNAGWAADQWRPDVIGRRLANWLAATEFLLDGAEKGFRNDFLDSAARQARHLRRTLRQAPPGAPRVAAAKGLIAAGRCLHGGDAWLRAGLARLETEIAAQVLPDGGLAERAPAAQLAVLCDLVDVRDTLKGVPHLPHAIDTAIDRMAPMVRFFRHGDGGLAQFNGGTDVPAATVDAVLRAAGAQGRAPARAPHSGFERVQAGEATLIADVGAAPPPGFDRNAHAGTLSFEFSHGGTRIVVNCGSAPEPEARLRRALRATAAHSTLILADTNSSEIVADEGLGRHAHEVERVRALEDGATLITAAHDGYAPRFGLVHRRRWFLSPDGTDLRGDDTLEGQPGAHGFAVRFHLHPGVSAGAPVKGESGRHTLPIEAGGDTWRFHAEGATVRVEDSVYCDGRRRPSRQIVVVGRTRGDASPVARIRWALRKAG